MASIEPIHTTLGHGDHGGERNGVMQVPHEEFR
jgi:hypothetical protein